MAKGGADARHIARLHLAQPIGGQRRRQHGKTGARERLGEGHQARVAMAERHHARHQQHPGPRPAAPGQVQIAVERLAVAGKADLDPLRRGRQGLERAGRRPGDDVRQDQRGSDETAHPQHAQDRHHQQDDDRHGTGRTRLRPAKKPAARRYA
jgi:hypothetical protein